MWTHNRISLISGDKVHGHSQNTLKISKAKITLINEEDVIEKHEFTVEWSVK